MCSLIALRRLSLDVCRQSRRNAIAIPRNVPRSATLVARIQRRLQAVQLQRHVTVDDGPYQLESIAAERFFQRNKEQFAAIANVRDRELQMKTDLMKKTDAIGQDADFPLASRVLVASATCIDSSHSRVDKPRVARVDRGFFVTHDKCEDEYIHATVCDMPEDEMTRPLEARVTRHGAVDAVEEIDFQLPGQGTIPKASEMKKVETQDWLGNYGRTDASVPASTRTCAGCGARFHCQDTSLPGFVPLELFSRIEEKDEYGTLCRRCHLLKHHNFLLNVNVTSVDYESMMRALSQKQEALILLIVDMTDLPGSIYRALPALIGERKPMIVIGNKVDLLPPDSRSGYLRHFRDCLNRAIASVGFDTRFHILHTALISARTGFGVEELITKIHLNWTNIGNAMRDDIYLIGCTNTGKSTLFNAFLQSDLCKVKAVDLVHRATTSVWPGTTLALLKFPLMNPSTYRLELRRRRLLTMQNWQRRERQRAKEMLHETGEARYAVLQARVENSFKEKDDIARPISKTAMHAEFTGENESEKQEKKVWNPEQEEFKLGRWCFDTPGTVNHDQAYLSNAIKSPCFLQLLNLLTLEELIAMVPRRLLRPRTVIVQPGKSLLIAGIARLDIRPITGTKTTPTFMTVFASDRLPLHCIATANVDAFMRRYENAGSLVVPIEEQRRGTRLPELQSVELCVDGVGADCAAADVVLSSVGWVSVSSPGRVHLHAFTPSARGIHLRMPPLLPYAVQQRGARKAGTEFYRVRPVRFPVNQLRREAERQRRKKRQKQ